MARSMKSAAERVRVETALRSWTELDGCLREARELQLQIAAIQGDHDKKVAALRDEAEQAIRPIAERLELIGRWMKEFTEAHRSELDGKSKVLNHGQVGFRQSTKIVIKRIAETVAELKKRGLQALIRTKEEPDKEALKKYDDAFLAAIGAKRKVDDTFWYEVASDEVKTPA